MFSATTPPLADVSVLASVATQATTAGLRLRTETKAEAETTPAAAASLGASAFASIDEKADTTATADTAAAAEHAAAYLSEDLNVLNPNDAAMWSKTPLRQLNLLFRLFFSPRFIVHRVTGLIYLLQMIAAFFLYFYDYSLFRSSPLTRSLPLTGVMQSITAIYTFTFLPKKMRDPGYFSDKYTITYPFIIENSFFAGLLLFQWLYFDDLFFDFFKDTVLIESCVVFLPYLFRDMWPKTRFRDSLESKSGKTVKNQFFYNIAINIARVFYMWAKHYIGYFLNYARFMDRVTPNQTYHIYLLELFSSFATTVAVFLHTLKFKKYMGPRASFLVYMGSYLATFYTYVRIHTIFMDNLDLTLITLGGLLINFKSRRWQLAYQIGVLVLLNAARYKQLPTVITDFMPLLTGHYST